MAKWIKANKLLIISVVTLILQNIGILPPAVNSTPSVDTKAAVP